MVPGDSKETQTTAALWCMQAGRASAEMTSRITTLDERFAGPPPELWSVVALPRAATETTERCVEFELALQQQARPCSMANTGGRERDSIGERDQHERAPMLDHKVWPMPGHTLSSHFHVLTIHAGEGRRLFELVGGCELDQHSSRPAPLRWQAQVVRQVHGVVERLGASI